jgi:hypothetical protein
MIVSRATHWTRADVLDLHWDEFGQVLRVAIEWLKRS